MENMELPAVSTYMFPNTDYKGKKFLISDNYEFKAIFGDLNLKFSIWVYDTWY